MKAAMSTLLALIAHELCEVAGHGKVQIFHGINASQMCLSESEISG